MIQRAGNPEDSEVKIRQKSPDKSDVQQAADSQELSLLHTGRGSEPGCGLWVEVQCGGVSLSRIDPIPVTVWNKVSLGV